MGLPNDDASRELVKSCLEALAGRFDDDDVKIDKSVFNAGRIIKLYGTVANKGDNVPLAPWRLSRLRSIPDPIQTVSTEQLNALAAEVSPQPAARLFAERNSRGAWTDSDVSAFLARGGIDASGPDPHNRVQRWKLKSCPFNPDHGPTESAVFLSADGKLGFKCQHNSCADRHWRDLREHVDGPRELGERMNGAASSHDDTQDDPLKSVRIAILTDLNAGPEAIDAATPPRFVCHPILPVGGANFAGPGGTGKTATVLGEMVRVACGGELYGHPVDMQGPCVLVTAEDGADYARYVLQQVLQDGVDSGHLPDHAAQRAKSDIRIIGWRRPNYGAIVEVDESGAMRRAPVYDLLLEQFATVRPVYVTLDPAVLFSAGERYGNDGDAYFAAMLHETALSIAACVQVIDHVAQSVPRSGIIDQYAARGGTAKTDNARLARQLVRVTPEMAEQITLPLTVSEKDIVTGKILQLHTTKSNYAPLPPPAWLRRRHYWIEYLRAPSADESAAQVREERAQTTQADAAVIVEYVRQRLSIGDGTRLSQRDIEESRPALSDGQPLSRARVREAVRVAVATGMLRHQDLPEAERRGQRKTYLVPIDALHISTGTVP